MGLLKGIKNAFVEEESVNTYNDLNYGNSDNEISEEELYTSEKVEVNSNIDQVDESTLISNIYESNNLTEMSKSIFKVEELMKSLGNLSDDTKKTTTISILQSFNLDVETVVNDGINRVKVINSVKDDLVKKIEDSIYDNREKIEEYKIQIEQLEKEILESTEEKKTIETAVENETNKINSLVDFIK